MLDFIILPKTRFERFLDYFWVQGRRIDHFGGANDLYQANTQNLEPLTQDLFFKCQMKVVEG